jgi:pyrroline-5-carboxylate reductase
MLARKRIAVIGAGKLGETLIKALLEAKVVQPEQVVATARHAETVARKGKLYGIRTGVNNAEAAKGADLVIVSVKPQAMAEALGSMKKVIGKGQVVISTAASVSTAFIERHLASGVPVIRTMPNTACLVRAGMTGIAGGTHARREHLALAEGIFSALGRALVLDEKYMDAVTGLSASGIAFMYVTLESMAEGGVAAGLPREIATELAAQAMLGAARMVQETREHPAKLKDVVTTPAGTTIDGLLELESGGLRVTLIKSVVQATKRAGELLHG